MKTPIKKAAEAIGKELPIDDVDDDDIEILANIIRRVLIEEVPKRTGKAADLSAYSVGYDKCRRDIGLED